MNDDKAIETVDKIMKAVEYFAFVGNGEDRDGLLNALYEIMKGLK